MFHFAGGNSYSFRLMNPNLKEFEVVAIELPGRGMRYDEPLVTDYNHILKDIYRQVINRLDSETFLLYGHSMGAILAFHVVKMLEEVGLHPLHLIVTGSPGPKIKTNEKIYLMDDKSFIEKVKELGGLPEEIYKSQEILDYFIPILKADFEICDKNTLDVDSVIHTPIFCIMGDDEKQSSSILNWSKYTRSLFQCEIHSGNHFFIYNSVQRISEIIKNCSNILQKKIIN